MNEPITYDDDELIPQNHERGPGWFLKISYVVIIAFCVYYLFTYWSWKSGYDKQQEQIKKEIAASVQSSGN
ncbi:MAG: hypothetical protein ONB44_16570 [candidate division KSB1 bacterium]|nr:hypothetical protein [candidate division KSB1 bacterium]MDZ7303749.1 hypothetical protein [candidate division KSB1 bacterium]MDZ7314413.1 hypothetical protein [candidate division KSB1 bacterium]